MKLIHCITCGDVVALRNYNRTCECGSSYGKYKDNLNAVIGGNAIPVGFVNTEFQWAVYRQPDRGMGKRFEAFVIPKECDTIEREV